MAEKENTQFVTITLGMEINKEYTLEDLGL